MKKILPGVRACTLFAGIADDDLLTMLNCLSAREARYKKGAYIFSAEDEATCAGIVAAGSVHVIKEDYWGNRAILAQVPAGGLFAESFSCAGVKTLPVSVVAAEDAAVLLVDYRRVVATCTNACAFHTALIANMLRVIAEKNVALTEKLEHVTQRSTRAKLLSYLSEQAKESGSGAFDIPFNRQELADYLSVERSGMSAELCRMRDEGLLEFRKNHFELSPDACAQDA